MEIGPARGEEVPAVRALLAACGLDASDVDGKGPQRLLVARDAGGVAGCIALEVHGDAALLRSFAVDPARRRAGLGAALEARAAEEARRLGVRTLYLLTTTVRDRALRDGFAPIDRDDVPGAIRAGSQFRGACPATAACMRINLW